VEFSILESVPDAMIIADEDGTIVHSNGVAERLFGWTREELVGQPVEVLLPARFRAMHQVHRAGYHTAPRTRPMGLGLDLSGRRKDGGEFAAEISLSPVVIDGRRCVMAAVRDVTERKKIEDRARLWREAQAEVRERDEFLSIASHELRTPVTALLLQLQLLQRVLVAAGAPRRDASTPHVVGGKVDAIERQTRRIAVLVNELLDVSRMRLGRLELRTEPLDLADIARSAADHLREEIQRAGSGLALDLRPATGRWDRTRLEQVVTNLLLNASKFGAGKPIVLAVEGDEHHARVRVSDRGMGIAPEHQRRVFERFERAVSPQNFGGLGLGLYIARQIVEAHGGVIRVDSTPGEGATFTVEIPREPPAAMAADAAASLH
jgi:PAS domain S-box-containing protein